MITLRPYQQRIVDKIIDYFKKGVKHILVEAPTGSGKTIIFSYIAQGVSLKNNKVLVLTDRVELLTQAGGAFKKFGLMPYFIQAGTKYLNFDNNTYIGMSQTLRRRITKSIFKSFFKKLDLIVIDEAHKQEFNYLFESGLIDDIKVLGFTATPSRSGKMRQLGLDYEKMIHEVSVKDLIDEGYLVPDDYTGVKGANLEDVSFNALKGDYDDKDLFQSFNTPKLYAGALKNWKEICPNTQTMVFCVNVEHCIHTVEEFQNAGIDARFVVSGMSQPKRPEDDATKGRWVMYEEKMRLFNLYKESFGKWSGDRTAMVTKFKRKDFTILVNCGIFTTGFDYPGLETIIMLRATMSVSLWLQILGRGSRPCKEIGKTHFNVLDFGGNSDRLGHYSEPRLWSLWHESRNNGEGTPPIKECGYVEGKPHTKDGKKGCRRLIMASYKICPFCGFKYPDKQVKEIELVNSLYDTDKQRAVYVKRVSEMDDKELYDYFKAKSHKSAWLWRQLWYRGKEERIKSFGSEHNWSSKTINTAINYMSNFS